MYTPSKANVAKFSQHLLSTPSNYKPAPVANTKYSLVNGILGRLQAKLNPYINQANTNASTIHNYVAGNTSYPTYTHPNVGGSGSQNGIAVAGSNGGGNFNVSGSSEGSTGRDYSQYAQYLPYLQQMADKVMQQRMPKMQDPVDLSPYLAFAQNVRNRSQA